MIDTRKPQGASPRLKSWADVRHPSAFLAPLLEDPPDFEEVEEPEICSLCGAPDAEVPLGEAVSGAYMDHNLHTAPESDAVCCKCFTCFKDTNSRYRNIVAWETGGDLVKKQRLREVLEILPDQVPEGERFFVAVTTSYKKHVWLKAPINSSTQRFQIQLDDKTVEIENHEKFVKDLERTDLARAVFNRAELLGRDASFLASQEKVRQLPMHKIKKFGPRNWEALKRWMEPIQNTTYFEFLVYLSKKTELPEKQGPGAEQASLSKSEV